MEDYIFIIIAIVLSVIGAVNRKKKQQIARMKEEEAPRVHRPASSFDKLFNDPFFDDEFEEPIPAPVPAPAPKLTVTMGYPRSAIACACS